MNHSQTPLRWLWIAGFGTALAVSPASAQFDDYEEYEYQPDEGWHEEEWYDPSDWGYDGPANYESSFGYDYDPYAYDYATWDTYPTWGYDAWATGWYDNAYWDAYDWNDSIYDEAGQWTATTDTGGNNGNQSNANRTRTFTAGEPEVVWQDRRQAQNRASDRTAQQRGDQQRQERMQNQRQQQRSNQQAQQGQSMQRQRGQQQQLARLEGTIEGLQTVQLRQRGDRSQAFTVAKISLQNGRTTVANLGPQSQMQNVNLERGDRIEAIGRRGRIDGSTVFVAHQLRIDGQTIDANPVFRSGGSRHPGGAAQQTRQVQSQRQQPSNRVLQGEVDSFHRVSTGQDQAERTLVQIRLENGRKATVDFGPNTSPADIGLTEGDRVSVRGRVQQINGRSILIPNQLRVEGRSVMSVTE